MLGVIFTSLIEMLEEKVSPEFADEVITQARLDNDGAYTAVGYYPFDDMQKLLSVLVEKTQKSSDALLHDFGVYLFGRLADSHASVLTQKNSLLDVLEHLDGDIHVQVKKLYPDADLPRFTVLSRTDNAMRLRYYSERELTTLAEGLLQGAAQHFDCEIACQTLRTAEPHTFEFSIEIVA
ncbi:heme NO-binding domain-containing protein [Alteromonas sp. CYL-A6]|uniref:heme NO-binding domain-containing protein n=1 Tax=Alteromonas nitratireducens TaxID=3390813 RepID=UPI0034BAB6B6